MSMLSTYLGMAGVALVLGAGQVACNSGGRDTNDTAAAPTDTAAAPTNTAAALTDTAQPDTITAAAPAETAVTPRREAAATPPVTPPQPEVPRDTPPAGAAQPSGGAGSKVTQAEYEGWRQYSVNCARCHGQDVLPNPVAANLLISLAPGGPVDTQEKFFQVVNEGRPERGMPAFKAILTPDQTRAIYAYVKGRAEKHIPPGRPARP